jgi:pyridoxal phosphate enzyme (YggS family)
MPREAEKAGRSPSEVTLVAVTKTVDAPAIQEAFAAGLCHFGESRMQEAKDKIPALSCLDPRPTWHLVGHLQTNKAKTAAEMFDVIHSIDSLKVAEAMSQHSSRDMSVLVQVNVAGESSKHGFVLQDTIAALEHIARLPHLRIKGLMTIAPYADDPEEVRPVFRRLRPTRAPCRRSCLSAAASRRARSPPSSRNPTGARTPGMHPATCHTGASKPS